jgi:hypothetical protein
MIESIPAPSNGMLPAAPTAPVGVLTPPTLLGRTDIRIPVGGRIRAGIKVLTRRAEEVADARSIYAAGVAAGKSFDTIERELTEKLPNLKNPLTPKNVPYFTVRGQDFPNPVLAQQIMERFAEDRGDGVRRLYRFPVVFPADAWQHVMPHQMVAWTANERRYWSEYSADGQTRFCKTHEAVPVDAQGRRTIRVFGGRKAVLRAANGGRCEPETCGEYQTKKCNLSGRFIFFMPGIKSISAFELPTNSFYAMQAAIDRFQTIGFMRGGRISGFLDRQRTPFYITKRLVEVSRIDDEGRAVRVAQWLIELEAPVDVTALLHTDDDDLDALEVRADEAVRRLEGRQGAMQFDQDTGCERVESAASRAVESPGVSAASPPKAGAPGPAQDRIGTPAGPVGRATAHRPQQNKSAEAPDVQRILDAARALGIDGPHFDAYADKRWGKGWKLSANGRKRALDEVLDFAGDSRSFQEKVHGALEVLT